MRQSDRKPTITPYWECFPSFFAYPFKFDALLPLLCFALGFGALLWLMGFGLFAGLAFLLLLVSFFRFAFSVLERSAQGYLGDNVLAFEHGAGHRGRPYKHFVALLVAGVLTFLVAKYVGHLAAQLFSLVLLLAWPASLMQLTLSDSLLESISPLHLFVLITQIGLPYLGLWACIGLLSVSSGFAGSWLPKLLGTGFVAIFVGSFVFMYFVIVMYRLMGYVLYQYHEPLGLFVHVEPAQEKSPQEVVVDEVSDLLQAGDTRGALLRLRSAIRQYPYDLSLQDRYIKLLLATDEAGDLKSAAADYLNVLVGAGRLAQALVLIETVQARHADFAPRDGTTALELAQLAHDQHKTALSVALIRGFEQRYPRHPDAAVAMLLAARILCERQRNDAQARKMLLALLSRYPQHAACQEARKLLLVIDRLGSTAQS
ncbi:tetratricopeptide repeat protein [Andreprevotia chitinilytica]|uniref:tetratricopeptide repeat protein n=1 Tax=Andreprevotia chitinilytica TaxID=396808 RepID=UPI000550EB39|nr:hypothetical protein [Andreprevotia chitinilytica]